MTTTYTIDLYEGNGGQLYAAVEGQETAIANLEQSGASFAQDAAAWNDWANDAEQDDNRINISAARLGEDWCPLVASYDSATGEVTVHKSHGRAAREYLGSDAQEAN